MTPNERLRDLRQRRKMSLQNLADAVGLSKAHVHQLERDEDVMLSASYRNLCNIAAALGVSVSKLMEAT